MKHLTLVTDNTDDKTFAEPKIGEIVSLGATVLALTKRYDRVIGDSYASWVTVCYKSGTDYHPFVVWTLIARPEGFVTEHGDYAFTLTEAMSLYEKRGGK